MPLDKILVVVLIALAALALIYLELHSRRQGKKTNLPPGQSTREENNERD